MTTPYKGQSTWWSTIASFLTADWVDEVALRQSINRLRDGSVWLRDEITRRTAALASTSIGAPARVIGSGDLTTLVYDDISGDLNGLDLQVQTDNSGVKTVAFGIGKGAAPTGPGDVVTAVLAATGGNPGALVDAAGHLNLTSLTQGGTGTIAIVGGSALALLGFAVGQNATGSSSGNSGDSLVGVGPISGQGFVFGGGPLRSLLLLLADGAMSIVVPPDVRVKDGPGMFVDGSASIWILDTPTVTRQIPVKAKLPNGAPPRIGTMIRVKRPTAGPAGVALNLFNEATPAVNIVSLAKPPAGITSGPAAVLYWTGTKWSLLSYTTGANPGSDAD
jgi:hypothetical protein